MALQHPTQTPGQRLGGRHLQRTMLGTMSLEAGQQRRGNAMVDRKPFRVQLSAQAAHAGQHQVQPLAVITTTGDLLGRLDEQNAMRLRVGVWSARRGTYRVLYRINEDLHEVVALRVEHRRDVYRPM